MKQEWVTSIRDQCEKHDVAFFFKQWGGRKKGPQAANLMESITTPFQNPKNAGRPGFTTQSQASVRQ